MYILDSFVSMKPLGRIPDLTHDLSLPRSLGEPSDVPTAWTEVALSSCLNPCLVQLQVCSLTAAAEICAAFTHLPAVDCAVPMPHTPTPTPVTECGQFCPVFSFLPHRVSVAAMLPGAGCWGRAEGKQDPAGTGKDGVVPGDNGR